MLLLSLALLVGAIALYVLVPSLLIYWDHPLPVYVLLAGSVTAALASRRRGALRWVTVGATGLLTVLFVVYVSVLSDLEHGELSVRTGDPFPDFTLETSTGERFSPSGLEGKSAALYVFYRGHW